MRPGKHHQSCSGSRRRSTARIEDKARKSRKLAAKRAAFRHEGRCD